MNAHAVRPGRFVPRLEALEARCLPRCSVTEFSGMLTVVGDRANNSIEIEDDGSGNPGNVTVICEEGRLRRTATGAITRIVVRTGHGNDEVSYFRPKLQPGVSRRVEVRLGPGDDTFGDGSMHGLSPSSSLEIIVLGGAGNDVFGFTRSRPIPSDMTFRVEANASLHLGLAGESGNDAISVLFGFRGSFDSGSAGRFSIDVSGGKGRDDIDVDLGFLGDSTGPATARLRGDRDADRLTLVSSAPGGIVDALIDGGPPGSGRRPRRRDRCFHTPNVGVVNCERVVP